MDFTIPDRNLPRMDTSPVNGHFLSTKFPSIAARGVLKPKPTFLYHRMFCKVRHE